MGNNPLITFLLVGSSSDIDSTLWYSCGELNTRCKVYEIVCPINSWVCHRLNKPFLMFSARMFKTAHVWFWLVMVNILNVLFPMLTIRYAQYL